MQKTRAERSVSIFSDETKWIIVAEVAGRRILVRPSDPSCEEDACHRVPSSARPFDPSAPSWDPSGVACPSDIRRDPSSVPCGPSSPAVQAACRGACPGAYQAWAGEDL
jgi:hypothetical protein